MKNDLGFKHKLELNAILSKLYDNRCSGSSISEDLLGKDFEEYVKEKLFYSISDLLFKRYYDIITSKVVRVPSHDS